MSQSNKDQGRIKADMYISNNHDKMDNITENMMFDDYTDNLCNVDQHNNTALAWNYLKSLNIDNSESDVVPVFNNIDPLAMGFQYFNSANNDFFKVQDSKIIKNENATKLSKTNYSSDVDLGFDDPMKSAKDKRRERNKVFARKTRIKRKMELEELRDKVCHLKMENDSLKGILGNKLSPDVSNELILKCSIQLPDNVDSFICHLISRIKDGEIKLIDSLLKLQRSFCICSAVAPDCPIVYASPGFCYLTGYDVLDVLGKNCRFLQGPETDRVEVAKLKQALCNYQECSVILKNYRRDGSEFWNHIQMAPLKDFQGLMTLIVGVQVEVENPPSELRHLKILSKVHSNFNSYYDDILPMTLKDDYRVPTNKDLHGFSNSEGSTTSSTTAEASLSHSDTSSASDY